MAMPTHNLSTKEFAAPLKTKPQTVLKHYCLYGHYYGCKPIKLPNRFLLWSEAEQQNLLEGKK